MSGRPHLLIISHVLPFPGNSGQQQRVAYTVRALRAHFDVSFLTTVPQSRLEQTRRGLRELGMEPVVLPSVCHADPLSRLLTWAASHPYAALTGLRASNYVIGSVEFAPRRIAAAVDVAGYDAVLFEYWHAWTCTALFQQRGTPCILDMHDVLWHARERQLRMRTWVPLAVRKWAVARYRQQEERAWGRFDAVVAISEAEAQYVRGRVESSVFYVPMGVDLSLWPFTVARCSPPRFAYYGGLGSRHNEEMAVRCAQEIMPAAWRIEPACELWIVGSNPSPRVRGLARPGAVTVTGFVPEVKDILCSMTAVLCPWSGTYGFRSRLVEVMALGVPVIASPDAVHGMGFEEGKGVLLANSNEDFVNHMARLMHDPEVLREHGRCAREQVERRYGYEATYARFAGELQRWLGGRRGDECA